MLYIVSPETEAADLGPLAQPAFNQAIDDFGICQSIVLDGDHEQGFNISRRPDGVAGRKHFDR